jgi:NADPH:quinone reductase-like Zn-dependent oxidoreductase
LQSLRPTVREPLVPGAGDALLRVRAVCLNHRDLKVMEGTYGARRPTDRVPVSDGIGEVIAVGGGVSAALVGRRAICGHFVRWLDGPFSPAVFGTDLGITVDGWLAEEIVVPAAALVTIPDTMTDEQAVALPAAGLTAWNALVEVGRIKAGDRVLALGTGGVSMFALQIAKMHGARVVITSSSDEKLATVRAMGADATVNYRTHPDWGREVMAQTQGAGADIVVETGGFATLGESIAAAAVNGRIVVIGALGGASDKGLPNFSTLIGKNLTLRGIAAGSRAMLQDLVDATAANGMTTAIARRFPFDAAADAYACLKSGDPIGKIMIRVAS